MQSLIYFFMIFALSLAKDVSVYKPYDFFVRTHGKPVLESAAPWKFGFTSRDQLHIAIFYWNQLPSVTKGNVTFVTNPKTSPRPLEILFYRKKVTVYELSGSESEVMININVYTSNGLCRSIRVAEGRVVSNKSEKEYKYTDICLKKKTRFCVLRVDLKDFICKGPSNVTRNNENLKTTTPLTDLENNNTTFVSNVISLPREIMKISTSSSANNTETNYQQPSPLNVLIYVIPTVIAMSVIILVIYIIRIKKYCHRNSHPVETIEMKTYATSNEVVYADLSMVHGNSQPPRRDEESPYAEIIGVLHPHLK